MINASVVVPTYKRSDLVLRSLRTIFAQDFPASEMEVIVVADGCTETVSSLAGVHPPCDFRVLEQPHRGPSAARNTGWRAASAEIIIFLDDDMFCDPGLVRAHCEAHRSNQSIVGVGAVFLSPESPRTLAAESFNREVGEYSLLHRKDPTIPFPVGACISGNTSVRKHWLAESEGFDERFQVREDIDLCVRMISRGVQPRYIAGAVAYQHYTKTASDLVRDAEAYGRADRLFVREHPQFAGEILLGKIAGEPRWKRAARRFTARLPFASDVVLAPLCWLADALPNLPLARKIGMRALQLRRGVHYCSQALAAHEWAPP